MDRTHRPRPGRSAGSVLGEAQQSLLGELKRRGEASVAELAVAGLARETIRDHLRALETHGLVERSGVRRAGRGRPRVLYRLTGQGDELFPQRHGRLLRELVEFLDGGGRLDVLEDFFDDRTRRKRRELLPRVEHLEGAERSREVAAILSEEGFLAEVVGPDEEDREDEQLRLCHCPWRELVAVTQVPCRAEMTLVSDLLGRRLAREMFMPDGDSSCSYSMGPAAPVPRPTV